MGALGQTCRPLLAHADPSLHIIFSYPIRTLWRHSYARVWQPWKVRITVFRFGLRLWCVRVSMNSVGFVWFVVTCPLSLPWSIFISCPTLENLQARLEACGTADSCKSCWVWACECWFWSCTNMCVLTGIRMGSLPSFAIQMAVVLRTIHLAERQLDSCHGGIECGSMPSSTLPGCVHFGLWCEPQPRLSESAVPVRFAKVWMGLAVRGVSAQSFTTTTPGHLWSSIYGVCLCSLWSAYRNHCRRNQVVAVFDEWGLGYADGMPSSSHKARRKSALQ